MRITRLLIALTVTFGLSACGEATAVIPCAMPTSLDLTTGLKVGGELSIPKAQGAVNASISKELTAKFASSDPDKWISIAKTYQYQSCQFINAADCGDLPESECFLMKKNMFNEAFDKINAQLNDQNTKLEIEKDKLAKIRADSCVAEKIAEYGTPRTTSTEGGARAPSPGIGGGRKTDRKDVCHSVGENQLIVSATTTSLSCHGGRCSVTDPSISNDNKRVCVTTTAWSDSKSFGGGGSAKYRLDVVYKNVAGTQVISGFLATCKSENA